MIDLGTLPGGTSSYGKGINHHRVIVGTSDTPSAPFAAVAWKDGDMTLLPTLPGAPYSYAAAINDHGQVAGTIEPRSVLWDRGSILELGVPTGGISGTPAAINDRGDIVGQYNTMSGDTRAVLWTTRAIKH